MYEIETFFEVWKIWFLCFEVIIRNLIKVGSYQLLNCGEENTFVNYQNNKQTWDGPYCDEPDYN